MLYQILNIVQSWTNVFPLVCGRKLIKDYIVHIHSRSQFMITENPTDSIFTFGDVTIKYIKHEIDLSHLVILSFLLTILFFCLITIFEKNIVENDNVHGKSSKSLHSVYVAQN